MRHISNLSELTDLLDLEYPFDVQDWEIVNSDPDKVGLFLDVYKTDDLPKHLQIDLIELILNSLNSKLADKVDENGFIADKDDEKYWHTFREILNEKREDIQFAIDEMLEYRGVAPEEEIKECLPLLLLFEKEFGGSSS